MKTKLVLLLTLAALLEPSRAEDTGKPALTEPRDKVGYSIGAMFGGGLKRDAASLNIDSVVAGLKDAFTGQTPKLSAAEQEQVLGRFRKGSSTKAVVQTGPKEASNGDAAPDPILADEKGKAGYSIGVTFGAGLKLDSADINFDAVVAGLKDSFAGVTPQLTVAQQEEVLNQFKQESAARMTERQQEAGAKAKKDGEEFLAANKTKKGVKALPSGLQYKVLSEGTGPHPKPSDQVTVHYRGKLVDGTEIDNSYKRGEPSACTVNQLIKGWSEAICLMRPGAKWEVFIPPSLAYGDQPSGRMIPPNATLVYEIELVSIKK